MIIVTIAKNREEWEKILSLPETKAYVDPNGNPAPVQYVAFSVPFRDISVTVFPPEGQGCATFSADWSNPPKPDPPLPVIGSEWSRK